MKSYPFGQPEGWGEEHQTESEQNLWKSQSWESLALALGIATLTWPPLLVATGLVLHHVREELLQPDGGRHALEEHYLGQE